MSDHDRLARLANLLYGMAAILFGGTILELLSARHFADPIQRIPFVLCGVGLVAILLVWKRPGGTVVQTLRGLMIITAASLLGVWKHVEGNIGFVHEMHPDASGLGLLQGALTGRAPLLASGALAVAAAIAFLATFAAGWDLRGAQAERRDATEAIPASSPLRSVSAQ